MAMLSAKRLVLACLALTLALCAGGAASAQAPLPKVVVTWGTLALPNLPLWIAYKAGYFKKHGLDVDLQYEVGTIEVASLLAGQSQIAQVGGAEVVSADVSGGDITVLATLGPIFSYVFMVPNSITSAAQLKGKVVGVTKYGDASDIGARVALRRLGLSPSDVTFVQVGSSTNRAAALISGAIQGGVMLAPMNLTLEAQGVHTLFNLLRLRLPASDITVSVRASWLNAHRDLVQRYMDALVDGLIRMRADKAFSVATLKEYYKSDDDRGMEYAYNQYVKEILPGLPYPRSEQFASSMEQLAAGNERVKSFDVSKIIDDSFLKSAAKRVR
jgi:NitT/TauT family transport system substrate-binding protein